MRILNDLIRYVDTLPLDSLVAVPRTLVRLNWRDMGLFKVAISDSESCQRLCSAHRIADHDVAPQHDYEPDR